MISSSCPLCAHPTAAEIATSSETRLMRCHACTLAYADTPRLDLIHLQYERLYGLEATVARLEGRRVAVFSDFFERVRPSGDGRLLDVGCGTGDFLLLARERGWRPTGIDLSERAAARARERGLEARTDWQGLGSEAFAAVTLWNVFEFVRRPLDMLRDVRRVLVPGGHVFIRTPNERFQRAAYRWRRRIAWCRPLARVLGDAFYFQPVMWNAATLATALTRGGFVDTQLWNSRPSAGDPYHMRSPRREAAVHAAKHLVHAWALGADAVTRGRVLIGSSISALARKPA